MVGPSTVLDSNADLSACTREIAERGFLGTDADYDRAHAELMTRGYSAEAAQYAIMSSCW